ncbi:hypothetical protein SLS56_001127 [Neofusicoccum ribis]|uniref:Uncharacterized protein n=1 Tax=Neofusicoccum ribis TaxID=45134 RepID=A0ABR3TAL4_9PEZI
MANVLEILAHLHHSGIIPESVYHYEPPKDSHSLQQPPTLYLLSSRIMTALSDAAWRAHESAVASAHKSNAQYTFLGHEIPGSRYKVRTPELGSEVWLELVLWSCLHGGWAIDGATILEKLRNYKGNSRWSVLSWRNILQDQDGSSFRNMTWTDIWSFARARGTQANSPDRFVVERTVSSEVIAAFIDRFLNLVDTGVGSRGLPFLDVYKFVTNLKDLLNRENLGLGSATWELVLVRFLESGAFDFNTEARLVSKMLYFTSKYDREHDYHNAPQKDENNPGSHSYILEPSAISLGILHQTLRIHINDGNLRAAARVTWQLHALTDENKKRSIQRFFEKLNRPSDNPSTPQESFSSNTSHFHYPAYSPQIPIPLLAGLLRLATKSQEYDFARKLLYSDNYDGPLIPYELYSRSAIAAALIEYAVAADDRPLIARLVESHQNKPGMSLRVSEVMMENQMRINNWDSVEKIIYALASKNEGALAANAGALIAKHLLILQGAQAKSTKEVTEHDPIAKAASMLRRLAKAKFGNSDRERLNRFHGILCVLLSVGSEWHGFCSKLIFYHGTRKLEISLLEQDFAQLLQGVTESRGAYAGMQLMVKWCKDVSHARPLEPQSHRLESSRSEYVLRFANLDVEKVSVTKADGSKLVLRGQRLQPRLPLMRTVYRAALASLENGSESPFAWRAERTQEVLEWALRGLEAMGLSRRDIGYELRGIYSLKILNRKVKRAEKRIRRKEEKAKELAEGHEPPQESEGEEHDDLD